MPKSKKRRAYKKPGKDIDDHISHAKFGMSLWKQGYGIFDLGEDGSLKATKALIEHGLSKDNSELVELTIKQLKEIGMPLAIKAIAEKGMAHEEEKVRDASIDALISIGTPLAIKMLFEYGMASDESMSCKVANKLKEASLQKHAKLICDSLVEKGLTHNFRSVAYRSTITLGEYGDERAIIPLINRLTVEPRWNDGEISRTLEPFGKKAVDALIKHGLTHKNNIVVENTIIALEQRGVKRLLPHLMKLTGHEDKEINKLVKIAIKRIQYRDKRR